MNFFYKDWLYSTKYNIKIKVWLLRHFLLIGLIQQTTNTQEINPYWLNDLNKWNPCHTIENTHDNNDLEIVQSNISSKFTGWKSCIN